MNAQSNAAEDAASDSSMPESANFSDLRRCLWTLSRLGLFCAAGWMLAFGLGRLYRPVPTVTISSARAQHGLPGSAIAAVPNVTLAVENHIPLQDQPATVSTPALVSTAADIDDARFPLKAGAVVASIEESHP